MKLKNVFAAGLIATMAFAACKKEVATENGDTALKSVTISLANLTTKSMDAPREVGKVALNEVQVFFADAAGNFYQAHAVEDASKAVSTYLNSELEKEVTFHYLDSKVTTVYVFGNCGKLENDTPETLKYANLNALKAELDAVTIESQMDFTNLKMYGTSGLTLASTAGEHGPSYYDATVNIAPLVSRIEIVGLNYKESTDPAAEVKRAYQSMNFQQFTLNNWYKNTTLTSLNVPAMTITAADLNNTTITDANVWTHLSDIQKQDTEASDLWYNDAVDYTLDVAGNYIKDLKAETAGAPAYHFFPGEAFPQIIARFTANDGTKDYPFYLATNGFNTAGADGTTSAITETNKVGKIYKVNFEFSDDDIKNPLKCVNLTVKVEEWVVVDVTPNFN